MPGITSKQCARSIISSPLILSRQQFYPVNDLRVQYLSAVEKSKGGFLLNLYTASTFNDPGLCTGVLLGGSKRELYRVFCKAHEESVGSVVSPFQGTLRKVSVQLRFLKSNTGGISGVIYSVSAVRVPSQVQS